ncbi:hypothetical protein JCM8097_004059 [Rhodosporidiobolus ruineniae]
MPQLLDLPPELLAHVFGLIDSYDKSGKRPICRALLPFTRRNLLDRVDLATRSRLCQFSRLVAPRSKREVRSLKASLDGDVPLGHLVRELNVWAVESDQDDDDEGEECKRGDSHVQNVRRIFSAVKHVEDLWLDGSALLKILFPSKRLWLFPKLRRLSLIDVDSEYANLYDMGFLSRLRRFKGLRKLVYELEQNPDDPDPELASPATVRRFSSLERIEDLDLTAGPSLSTEHAASFVSHFSGLQRLRITMTDLAILSLFFQHVSNTLTSLHVAFDYRLEMGADNTGIVIDPHLSRFVHLEHLSLGAKTFSLRLLPTLLAAPLPLKSLTLDCRDEPNFDASFLLAFVAARGGAARSLRLLALDAFYAEAGRRPSQYPDREDVSAGSFDFEGYWSLPSWTRAFSYDDAKELVRVAEAGEVKLEGSILEAIEVHELMLEEEKYLEGRKDDVLEAIRGLFGEL